MNGKLWSLRLGPVEVVNLLAVFFSGKSGHVCEVVSRSGDGVDGLHRGPRVGLHRRDPESGGHQRSLQRFPGNTFYSLPKEKLQILLQMSPSSFCFNFILYSLFTRIFEQHSNLFPLFFSGSYHRRRKDGAVVQSVDRHLEGRRFDAVRWPAGLVVVAGRLGSQELDHSHGLQKSLQSKVRARRE